jgi:hypothetical protein
VADGSSGLQIVVIEEADSPVLTGAIETPGFAWDVVLLGRHAYVADDSSLQVINIFDISFPLFVSEIALAGNAVGVDVDDTHAYVASQSEGLQVVDITDPEFPNLVGIMSTPGPANDIAVLGRYAYLAAVDSDMQVIDISDAAAPAIIGWAETPGATLRVIVSEDIVLLADGTGGLQVASQQCTGAASVPPDLAGWRIKTYPNPFNPLARISFDIPAAGQVQLSVYDCRGSLVTVLADRYFAAGSHNLVWQGRDNRGRSVPSGMYLVRLAGQSGVSVQQKVSLVR